MSAYGLLLLLLIGLLIHFSWPNLPVPGGPIPVPLEYAHVDAQTSVLIKTMNRREKVALLVKSIEALYPGRLTILIGDDGEKNERHLYESEHILAGNRIRYFWFGFDVGVSVGRNRLVDLCETKYAINMDDDMYWTSDTNIYNLFRVFEKTQADIITMSLVSDGVKDHYLGDLYQQENTTELAFCLHSYPPPLLTQCRGLGSKGIWTRYLRRNALDEREQCYRTEIGFTMYLSTKAFLAANPWSGVIGEEHVKFFYDMKQRQAKVVGCLNINVIHNYHGYSKIWDYGFWSGYKERRHRPGVKRNTSWRYISENDSRCCKLREESKKKIL